MAGQASGETAQGSNPLASLASAIPGGLAGGAAAGGVMALLMSSKSTRKMVGSAAKIGGSAVLGGLAYKAYSNWKQNTAAQPATPAISDSGTMPAAPAITDQAPSDLNLTMIKAMISAAKSDGNLDAEEQKKIFDAIEKMQLNPQEKAAVFDAISRDIPVQELAAGVSADDEKAQLYLCAYLAIEVDEERERQYLDFLAQALDLPEGLPAFLEEQAKTGLQ